MPVSFKFYQFLYEAMDTAPAIETRPDLKFIIKL